MTTKDFQGCEVTRGNVKSEWIDINDHMNVAYYILAFDQAVDALWEKFGITYDFINTTSSSTFAVESHITWQKELSVDEPYVITAQMLAYDEKRIHQFMRLYHRDHGYLSATAEWMNLHVNLETRRVAPWPEAILAQIAAFANEQTDSEWPVEAGNTMRVRKPLFSVIRGSA